MRDWGRGICEFYPKKCMTVDRERIEEGLDGDVVGEIGRAFNPWKRAVPSFRLRRVYRRGVIMAVLGFIDFFSTRVQRVALSTVANVCKKLPLDCSSLVLEAIPTLCNLLQYEDWKLVETAVTCLIRITDCFSNSIEILDELCKQEAISKSLHLISVDGRTTLISQTAFVGLIGLLTKLANTSHVAVLLQENFPWPGLAEYSHHPVVEMAPSDLTTSRLHKPDYYKDHGIKVTSTM
ncbi:E3 ubiquitin-protein ligase UPL4 [Platanthera guangdongensis]|uniref:HECT-type E3 ubiquitin transferase n=1 Tax=Platanthera guangdongensis TaxID=2320717 RepID=A0ABR2MCS9_9ASPA